MGEFVGWIQANKTTITSMNPGCDYISNMYSWKYTCVNNHVHTLSQGWYDYHQGEYTEFLPVAVQNLNFMVLRSKNEYWFLPSTNEYKWG